MSVKDDSEDFANTGLNGEVKKAMAEQSEAFVRVLEGGWRGERVPQKPEDGSGPYIHIVPGNPPMRYENDGRSSDAGTEFPVKF